MSDYQIAARVLKERIEELRRLRDAQDPEGSRFMRFQQEIEVLTDRLDVVEAAGPLAEELDGRIRAAQAAVAQAREEAEDAAGYWSRIALGTGACGAILIVVSLLVSVPWWVPTAGGVLVVALVAALFIGTKARQAAAFDVHEAIRAVEALEDERQELEPPPTHQALTTH